MSMYSVLVDALQQIHDKYGVRMDEVRVKWMGISSISHKESMVEHIEVKIGAIFPPKKE